MSDVRVATDVMDAVNGDTHPDGDDEGDGNLGGMTIMAVRWRNRSGFRLASRCSTETNQIVYQIGPLSMLFP